MRNLSIFLFIITYCTTIQAQKKIEFFSDVNFGVTNNSSLRNFHKELTQQVPYTNFKTTDNFKYNYGFTVGLKFNKKISIFFTNKVSGAKSSVADYSGYIRLTNELKGYTFGGKYDFYVYELSRGNLSFGAKVLITKSTLDLRTASEISNKPSSDEINFKSLDLGTGISMTYEYDIKFITVRAYLDFDIYKGGKLKFEEKDQKDLYLQDKNGNKVTTGWSGFNSGIGISIPLSKNQ